MKSIVPVVAFMICAGGASAQTLTDVQKAAFAILDEWKTVCSAIPSAVVEKDELCVAILKDPLPSQVHDVVMSHPSQVEESNEGVLLSRCPHTIPAKRPKVCEGKT